ncbi:hypothetical protein ONZ45_g11203 [Pleurotus djamor]|nr:hypothetical protein ONZ45_g11203 [Pleurotus djamor]
MVSSGRRDNQDHYVEHPELGYQLKVHIPHSQSDHTLSFGTHDDFQGLTVIIRHGTDAEDSLQTATSTHHQLSQPSLAQDLRPLNAPPVPVDPPAQSQSHLHQPHTSQTPLARSQNSGQGQVLVRTPSVSSGGSSPLVEPLSSGDEAPIYLLPPARRFLPSQRTIRFTTTTDRPPVPWHQRVQPKDISNPAAYAIPLMVRGRYPIEYDDTPGKAWYIVIDGYEPGVFYDTCDAPLATGTDKELRTDASKAADSATSADQPVLDHANDHANDNNDDNNDNHDLHAQLAVLTDPI